MWFVFSQRSAESGAVGEPIARKFAFFASVEMKGPLPGANLRKTVTECRPVIEARVVERGHSVRPGAMSLIPRKGVPLRRISV